MANIDIYCIADYNPADGAFWWDGFWSVGELYVLSLADILDKVKARLAKDPGSRIGQLRVSGHGTDHSQRFGADRVEMENIKDFEPCFAELAPLFGPGGIMILEGCGTGKAVDLLIALS